VGSHRVLGARAGRSGGDGEPGQGGREARADHTGAAQAACQQALHQLQQFGEPVRPDFSTPLAKCGRVLAFWGWEARRWTISLFFWARARLGFIHRNASLQFAARKMVHKHHTVRDVLLGCLRFRPPCGME
jgi:hypothetical protein